MLRVAFACLAVLLASALYAQAPVVPAVKPSVRPTIDGVVGDDEWANIPSFDGLVDQGSGSKSPESGKFWIAYDDQNIYFAARLNDSRPNDIRATEYRTNTGLSGDDTVSLAIDLSGSLSDFSVLQANPRGATSVSLAGGRAAKREWTGEIFARARTAPTGWEVEMSIPWNILPVPAAGKRDVRFNVLRYIPRLNRSYIHIFDTSGHAQDTPIWRSVELPRPFVDHRLKLLPYAYAGYERDQGLVLNSGLDLKTSLTDRIQLVGTINPDFRNIENAILSLDFSRFARIAAETRPFFQEGAEYLNSAIFASQTIQHVDVGVNSYGKINDKIQFGFLDTVDFGKDSATVANFSYIPNANDSYRLTATHRSTNGVDNDAYLLRYYKQIGAWSLFLRDMGSKDTRLGWGQNSTAELGYSKGGLFGIVDLLRVTPNFAPGLGFFPETNYQGIHTFFEYNRPFSHGPLQEVGGWFNATDFHRTTGERYRSGFSGDVNLTTRGGTFLDYNADRQVFEGSHDRIDTLAVSHPVSDPYRNVRVSYSWGEIGGSDYRLSSLSGAYRLFGRLQATASFQKFHLGTLDTDQTIVGGNYDLGGDRSISGRFVRTGGDTNFYIALRRSGNRGAEYYLIYGDPSSLTFRQSLILKVVVPFRV